MKLVIEVDIGEEGEACRAHTLAYVAEVLVQTLDTDSNMGKHGPFMPGPKDDQFTEDGYCSILESYVESERGDLTLEEVQALPVKLRMGISKQPFDTKGDRDGSPGDYRVIDTATGATRKLDDEYNEERHLNS